MCNTFSPGGVDSLTPGLLLFCWPLQQNGYLSTARNIKCSNHSNFVLGFQVKFKSQGVRHISIQCYPPRIQLIFSWKKLVVKENQKAIISEFFFWRTDPPARNGFDPERPEGQTPRFHFVPISWHCCSERSMHCWHWQSPVRSSIEGFEPGTLVQGTLCHLYLSHATVAFHFFILIFSLPFQFKLTRIFFSFTQPHLSLSRVLILLHVATTYQPPFQTN